MDCLDAETLADLFARRGQARDEVEGHLDGCGDCRGLVAALARASDGDDGESTPYARTMTSEAPPARLAAPEAGQLVAERYLLERVVGEGGMGTVWAARDLARGREVALKIIKDASRELSGRSWREARAATHVAHPSLIEVLDVVAPRVEGDAPVLVMPLLRGEPLDRVLARRGPLGELETLTILAPVASGMCAAHAKGIIHRDLKPPNVFLAQEAARPDGPPTVVVLDFGLAKLLSEDGSDAGADRLTRTGALLGTPHYMAPEQLFGEATVDHRADVWAVGVMLYECLTGKRPVEGRSYGQIAKNVARGAITPLAEIAPGTTPELLSLAARMLEKERDGRPDLFEVHAVFRRLLDAHPTLAHI